MKIWPALGIRLNRPFARTRNLSRREEVNGIQRGDDFTACQQLLQIVAIAELFVPEDADPKIRGALPGFVRVDEDGRNEHTDFLSTARATSRPPSEAVLPRSEIKTGVADGTRTRNSQNHNLELYH